MSDLPYRDRIRLTDCAEIIEAWRTGRLIDRDTIDYEPMVRSLFMLHEGIDPEQPYNNGRPYGDKEWAIDRGLATRFHKNEAVAIVDAALGLDKETTK